MYFITPFDDGGFRITDPSFTILGRYPYTDGPVDLVEEQRKLDQLIREGGFIVCPDERGNLESVVCESPEVEALHPEVDSSQSEVESSQSEVETPEITQSEIEALKARLYQCWNPPVAVREAATLVVQVRITLLPDGSLSGQPTISGITGVSNPLSQVAAEAAIRAVVQCAPFGDILRPENYALWNQIDFVFDPRQMLGG